MSISLEGRHVLAFCGASRVGKSTVARELARMLGSPYVSFGDYVRTVARKLKGRIATREELQDIGQGLVDSDPQRFCLEVLGNLAIPANGPLVVDGLRHRRIVSELHTLLPTFLIHIIFLEADHDTRMSRGEAIRRKDLMRIDSHDVEKDLHWLKSHADLVIDSTIDLGDILSRMESWIKTLNVSKTVGNEVNY